jgi:hypothetical protein
MKKINLKLISKLLVAVFGLIFLVLNLSPQAVSAATYDPNNVVSNNVFVNKDSMTQAQIEAFLVAHGSVWANYTIPQYITVAYPYKATNGNHVWGSVSVQQIHSGNPGSGDTTAKLWGEKVSQLIYNESQEHGINPQVVLAMLQKESSSITQKNVAAVTQAWALGYGYNETMAAYGDNQSTAQANAVIYGGIGQQISRAIMWLRINYNAALTGSIGATCDGKSMNSANAASQVLYLYTPHNQTNFFNLMQSWFNGGTAGYPFGSVPNTSLVKSGSNYYLIFNNTYYNLGSSTLALENYGYQASDASGDLSGYVSGGNLSNYIKIAGSHPFLVLGGLKYDVWPSSTFLYRWGLNNKTTQTISATLFNAIPSAPVALYGTIKNVSSAAIYYVDRGQKYVVYPSQAFKDRWGIKDNEIATVPDYFAATLPAQKPLAGLVKGETIGQVYYIDRYGTKFKIPLGAKFWADWGFGTSTISTISDAQLNWMPSGGTLSINIRGDQSSSTCQWSWGKCYNINSSVSPVSTISQSQFNWLPKI